MHYELATTTDTAIEYDGSLIQEPVTTIVQQNNNATQIKVTFNLDNEAQTLKNVEVLARQQAEIDTNETAILENSNAIGTIGDLDTTATDLVEAVNEVKTTADSAQSDATSAKTKTDYITVSASVDLGKVPEITQISAGAAISNATTPPSANVTLSSGISNFDILKMTVGILSAHRYIFVEIPTGNLQSYEQHIKVTSYVSGTVQYDLAFRLAYSDDTHLIAYYAQKLTTTFGSGTVPASESNMYIGQMYGIKL